MNTDPIPPIPQAIPKPEKKKGDKKQLQLEKLRISTEKLLLARVRATLTLITIGFAAYKFFYTRMENGKQPLVEFINGREIGLILISIGFVMLLLATAQHRKSIAKLKLRYKEMPYSISLSLSYGILLLALFLLSVILFRL